METLREGTKESQLMVVVDLHYVLKYVDCRCSQTSEKLEIKTKIKAKIFQIVSKHFNFYAV